VCFILLWFTSLCLLLWFLLYLIRDASRKSLSSWLVPFFSWYDIPELVVPIRMSLIEDFCYQGSFWIKGSYWLSWSYHFESCTVTTFGMESSQWENWNHLLCRKVLFLATPHCQYRGMRQTYLYLWYPMRLADIGWIVDYHYINLSSFFFFLFSFLIIISY
jgi:hypothetical protein